MSSTRLNSIELIDHYKFHGTAFLSFSCASLLWVLSTQPHLYRAPKERMRMLGTGIVVVTAKTAS